MDQQPARNHKSILYARARDLRRELTPAEAILWKHLRGRRFDGFKFRRQQPINEAWAIADFFCATARLVVELDGDTHAGREAADCDRQARLESQGYRVLRFYNHDVYEDIDVVLEAVWLACQSPLLLRSHPLPPALLPQGERGGKQ